MVDDVNIVHKRFLRWDENRECQITLEDENIVGADERGWKCVYYI